MLLTIHIVELRFLGVEQFPVRTGGRAAGAARQVLRASEVLEATGIRQRGFLHADHNRFPLWGIGRRSLAMGG